ncbi:uncharacterized protein LOC131317281 [Rhododendron vialii]|uniref:uncharacterized protein LOC131317281 n=1 Tax=Rhododendron vialii TaxID=182163 RepID=UPI00265DDD0E|nr:uncharacterized protein LOC131317281 [Rhododendron vialii]
MDLWWQGHANKEWCLSLAAVLMWYIWKCRNGVLFEHKLSLPWLVCKKAAEYFHEFSSANSMDTTAVILNGEGSSNSWRKPPHGMFKINVDGSWKKGQSKGGYGIVIRDSRGLFVAASIGVFPWCASSLVAEALAFRHGILLGSHLGLGSILIESDAQLMVNMLHGKVAISQEVEVIIHDIQVLSRNFHCCSYSFVRRVSNKVAHVLAGKGVNGSGSCLWTASPLLCVKVAFSKEARESCFVVKSADHSPMEMKEYGSILLANNYWGHLTPKCKHVKQIWKGL